MSRDAALLPYDEIFPYLKPKDILKGRIPKKCKRYQKLWKEANPHHFVEEIRMTIQTVNPSIGKVLKEYEEMSDQEIEEVIYKVHEAYENQHTVSFTERREKLHQVAELLLADKRDYAKLMAKEMGKPITAGEAEVKKNVPGFAITNYAEQAEEFLKTSNCKNQIKNARLLNSGQSYIVEKRLIIVDTVYDDCRYRL